MTSLGTLGTVDTLGTLEPLGTLGTLEVLGTLKTLEMLGTLGTLGTLGNLEPLGTLGNLGNLAKLGNLENLGNLYLGTFTWKPLLGNLYLDLGTLTWEPLLGNLGRMGFGAAPVCSETFTMAEDPKASAVGEKNPKTLLPLFLLRGSDLIDPNRPISSQFPNNGGWF